VTWEEVVSKLKARSREGDASAGCLAFELERHALAAIGAKYELRRQRALGQPANVHMTAGVVRDYVHALDRAAAHLAGASS
jgi:hypothetical protein